jgi:hypothetical protein
VTIVLIKGDRPASFTTATDAHKTIQSTLEARHPSFTVTYGTNYNSHKGEYVNGSSYRVDKFDPTQHGAVLPSIDRGSTFVSHLYLDNADMSNYYETVSIEQLSCYGSVAD